MPTTQQSHHRAVAHFFQKNYAPAPEVIVRAPGRINLIGEHTDYNGGFVLPAAIDKAIWFAAGRRADDAFELHALDLGDSFLSKNGETERHPTKNWVNYLLGTVSEARRDGHAVGGLNVVFGGNVPLGSGLSSSAALESGMAIVLNELFGLGLEKMDIVRLAQRAENRFVGMQCGIMDMFASVMGRAGQVVRLDCRSLEFEYFPFDAPDHELILCNSGVKHALVDSEYNTRRAECAEGVAVLQAHFPEIKSLRDVPPEALFSFKNKMREVVFGRCKYIIEEIGRVGEACDALKAHDLETFGALMYETHDGLRDGYEVSCPELDFLVETARLFSKKEVPGARMMGGGFGGCTLNLVKKTAVPAFLEKTKSAFLEKFGHEPECHMVKITDGAGRVY